MTIAIGGWVLLMYSGAVNNPTLGNAWAARIIQGFDTAELCEKARDASFKDTEAASFRCVPATLTR